MALVSAFMLATPKTASAAAVVYNTDPKGSCNASDLKINKPPFTLDDKKYYCISGLDSAKDLEKAGAGGTCPAGQPGHDTGAFGVACVKTSALKNVATGAEAVKFNKYKGNYSCGSNPEVKVTINIGCKGKGNPIVDMLFAVIRFLSIGVGIVIVGSIIVAGIQYTASRGDPQATGKALQRIRETIIALAIFIFAYALINWLVPGALLK